MLFVSSGSCGNASDPDALLEGDEAALTAVGQARFSAGDYAGALPRFEALCKLRPDEAHFADRFAHCLSGLKRWPEARHAWWLAIELHGRNAGRVNHLARAMIESEDYESAAAFLAGNRDGIPLNADLIIFSAVAALMAGRTSEALSFARKLEDVEPARSRYAINSLAAYLERVARQDRAAAALALLDALLPFLTQCAQRLQASIAPASLTRLWYAKLRCAREMIRLSPAVAQGHLSEVEALVETARFDEASQALDVLQRRFPRAVLDAACSESLDRVAARLSAGMVWHRAMRAAGDEQTFHALNLRVAAHLTLRQYEPAMEVAATGLNLYPDHEWFLLAVGRGHDCAGDVDAALHWTGKAAAREAASTNALVCLFQLQIKAGLRAAARETARRVLSRHPRMPLAWSLFKTLDQAREAEPEAEPAAARDRSAWLHGGDSGDVIYALAAMQGGGGGNLYLSCIEATREPMTGAKFDFLATLLRAQPYISGVSLWQGEPVQKDFTLFRHLMLPDMDLATQHWRCVNDDASPDVARPWLTVPEAARHGRPVFARSARYRNVAWDGFWPELKAAAPDALFVGTAAEFQAFGHGEHVFAADALELAQVIAGASVFVGNQSLPYAIAEGLKVGRLQEVSTEVPNCVFPGALALPFGVTTPKEAVAVAPDPPAVAPGVVFTGSRSALLVGWRNEEAVAPLK